MLMSDTTCHMSISLDGFVAGPEQSRDNPLGKCGRELHGWHIGDPQATEADRTAKGWLMPPGCLRHGPKHVWANPRRAERGVGRMVGTRAALSRPGVRADSPRQQTIEREGGTTFHFVTEGFDAAYSQALETADGHGVDIAGGASTVRQALNAGVIDELTLDIAPVLLGSGERIFDGVETFGFEPVEVLHSPLTTHIRYRRRSAG